MLKSDRDFLYSGADAKRKFIAARQPPTVFAASRACIRPCRGETVLCSRLQPAERAVRARLLALGARFAGPEKMNPNFRVQLRLNRAIDRLSLKLGVVVTPACKNLMEQMIANGVTRMQNQGVLEHEPQIRLAEDNIHRCLRELGNEAVEQKTFPNLEDKTFNIVMKRLCPLWPYC